MKPRLGIVTALAVFMSLTGCGGGNSVTNAPTPTAHSATPTVSRPMGVTSSAALAPQPTPTASRSLPASSSGLLLSPCHVPGDLENAVPGTSAVPTFVAEVGTGPHAVVLLHQLHGDHCDWMPFARRLAKLGLHVYVPDLYAPDAANDATRVAAFARGRKPIRTLAIVGASMGGTAALTVARDVEAARVAALSAPSTFGTMDALAAVRRMRTPLLFVAAADDEHFPADARQMAAAGPGKNVQLLIVKGGAHGTGLLDLSAGKGTVADALADFLTPR